MVKCWNCEHLMRVYSGKPANEKLFEKEFRKCKVKGIIFERYNDIREERECNSFKKSKRWSKTRIPFESSQALYSESQK